MNILNIGNMHRACQGDAEFKGGVQTGPTAPSADSTVANDAALAAAGWQLLGTVNTLFPWTEERQIVTQVKNTFSGPLVEATHLLFSVDFEYTFFGEIDILSTESYTPSGVSKAWLRENDLPDDRQALRSDIDGDALTAEEEFFAGTNPNDDDSFLQFSRIEFRATHQVLEWASVPEKTYTLWRSDPTDDWVNVHPEFPAAALPPPLRSPMKTSPRTRMCFIALKLSRIRSRLEDGLNSPRFSPPFSNQSCLFS